MFLLHLCISGQDVHANLEHDSVTGLLEVTSMRTLSVATAILMRLSMTKVKRNSSTVRAVMM